MDDVFLITLFSVLRVFLQRNRIMNDLKTLALATLDESAGLERAHDAVDGLCRLYEMHTGKAWGALDKTDITLTSGKAIAPAYAAQCLVYTPTRTIVFMRGIYKAILKQQYEFPGTRINIFYAGCGPYAALVTPFTALFSSDELSFHMLDIHLHSLEVARTLYHSLGIDDYVVAWVCDDATTCRLPVDAAIHIVISETMQRALQDEPQVAIMQNLIPQMAGDAIFIPELIEISARLLSSEGVAKISRPGSGMDDFVNLGVIYSIGRLQCDAPRQARLRVPMNYGRFNALYLFTDIRVFEEERLGNGDCHLTTSVWVADVSGKPGVNINFLYNAGSTPGFTHQWERFDFPGLEPPIKLYIGEQG